MKVQGLNKPFWVIGENIHTTRSLLREGKLVAIGPSGEESVRYTTLAGETRYLPILEEFRSRQDYQEGRVKHVMLAIRAAMCHTGEIAAEGMRYLQNLVDKQVKAGADYIDLNVDEFSWNREEQKAAMSWLVRAMEPLSRVPLSIDSSNQEILLSGIDACRSLAGKPMLNSASRERIEALDIAAARGLPVVVTAAGGTGMPSNAEERIENAGYIVDAALAKGIPLDRMFVDALVFPISVDSRFVVHCLDAFRCLRAQYGERIHLTGGLSNVSFGMPCRKLINEVFLNLAVEAGADSGIVDPVTSNLNRVVIADKRSPQYQLALEMLLGNDPGCVKYLEAYREGELESQPA
ncbi:MAG TPA: dihydropteroate synthase [Bryobacteraceae bacterium]|nr:dihydropteroate synthase [Bryobacteraceae bacterium]